MTPKDRRLLLEDSIKSGKTVNCRSCASCQSKFIPHGKQKYCSRQCYVREWSRAKRGYVAPVETLCAICRAIFVPHMYHPRAKTCSRKCSSRLEYEKHIESYRANARKWVKANLKKVQVYNQRCHAKNLSHYRTMYQVKQQRRVANFKNAPGSGVTKQDWEVIKTTQGGCCWWCGEPKNLHMDHVHPISKGGAHDPENIVGACRPCNSKKRDSLWLKESGAMATRKASHPDPLW